MILAGLVLSFGGAALTPASCTPAPAAHSVSDTALARRTLNQLLRQSRAPDSPSRDELLERLEPLGADGIAPALEILLRRSLPELDGAAPQLLSEPQRELLVALLQRWPTALTLERLEGELLAPPSFERAWAAIHVWGALSDARSFLRGAELAKAHLEHKKRRELLRNAVQLAAERLVRRDPRALELLRAGYENIDARLRLPMLAGVGATGDGRAAELLAHVLDTDEEHAPAALAQAQLLARSSDPEAHRRLCDELRERLSSDDPSVRIAAVRALGAQRDWRSIESMLELLEHGDEEDQSSVLWALRRATELNWHGVESWRNWHRTEVRWRDERLEFVLDQLGSNAQRQVVAALEEAAAHPLFAERTTPWAVDALRSANATVRRTAAGALALLDSPLAYPALIDALEDDDPLVVQAVQHALESLSGLKLERQPDAWRAALLL